MRSYRFDGADRSEMMTTLFGSAYLVTGSPSFAHTPSSKAFVTRSLYPLVVVPIADAPSEKMRLTRQTRRAS